MPDALPGYENECFFLAPIGKDGSEIRKRSDGVRDFIVKPAVADLGLTTLRADDLAKPGQITLQVIEHVLRAKGVVADLTGSNPNVFYELAIRHTAKLPVVLIADAEDVERLPFDIQQMRVIPFDHRDLASAAGAKEQISRHLREALDGAVDSPIATALTREALEQGNTVERTLAELVARVDGLASSNAAVVQQLRDLKVHGDAGRRLGPDGFMHALAGAFQEQYSLELKRQGTSWLLIATGADGYEYLWRFEHEPRLDDLPEVLEELGRARRVATVATEAGRAEERDTPPERADATNP